MRRLLLILMLLTFASYNMSAQTNVIGTTGNVLIGSTTDNNTGEKLQVTGAAGVTGNLSVGNTGAVNVLYLFGNNSGTGGGAGMSIFNGSNNIGFIGNYSVNTGGSFDGRFSIQSNWGNGLYLNPAGQNVIIKGATDDGINALQVTGSTSISSNLNVNGLFNGLKFGTTPGGSYYIGNVNAIPTSTSYQNMVIGSTGYALTSGFANFLAGTSWVGGAVSTGNGNLGIAGYGALGNTTTGNYNSAIGDQALFYNQSGDYNTAIGAHAGYDVLGSNNTMLGSYSGVGMTGTGNTVVGAWYPYATGITTGNYNTIIGAATGLASGLSNNIILADGQGNQRLNVDNNGNVGVGIANPKGILSLNNQISNVSNSNDPVNYTATNVPGGAVGQAIMNSYYVLNSDGSGPYPRYLDIASVGSPDGTNGGGNIRFLTNPIATGSPAVERMRISSSGNIGIGTTSPGAKLDVENGTALVNTDALAALGGQVTISNNYGNQNGAVRLNLNNGGAVSWIKGVVTGPNTNTGSAMVFGVPTVTADGTEAMRITSNGSLAIGTVDPLGYKLAVNGNVIATSVKVKAYANWPDYVFKKEHALMPLSELKAYVDKNQHLPEIPSAAEVEKNGQDLGEMNKLLVKKMEEMTLYMIEKDKQIKDQEQRLKGLEKQIEQLTKRIN